MELTPTTILQLINTISVVLYPLTFQPIFKERIWGGRNLESLYSKNLPPCIPIGESWEISDRPGDVSLVANGPLAGKDLHWLVKNHRQELLGGAKLHGECFPLLVKLLDAQQKLSLQVHPPAHKAAALRGEPKTEMWYVAAASPGAELYVGLNRGVTRATFEQKIREGSVAECFHRIPVKAGDVMFLPSGRVHAIGAGLIIFEIQQNSDTTYRVFDWNRVGLDGKPRNLHVNESLASIDFDDFEPSLVESPSREEGLISRRLLVQDPLFAVEEILARSGAKVDLRGRQMQILACLSGVLDIKVDRFGVQLEAGGICLVPACVEKVELSTAADSAFLHIT